MSRVIRIGTRGSKLALAQLEMVQNLLAANGVEVEPVIVRTSGDRGQREVLGAFVREIQVALLEDRVDAALHCLKDLPTTQVPGLTICAYLPREDARDAIITRHGDWLALPDDALIGTGSLRRTAQLLALRPTLRFKPLVGNVDTRLAKLIEGEYDGIVLAVAALRRLGLQRSVPHQIFDYAEMLPAPGQGTLVLETRIGESDLVARLNHRPTALGARAERSFLSRFGTGCRLPIGAIAAVDQSGVFTNSVVTISARICAPSGFPQINKWCSGVAEECEEVGASLANMMIEEGALDLLREEEK